MVIILLKYFSFTDYNEYPEEEEDSEENLVEDNLPCREKEQDYIYNYMKKGFETNGSYSALYISGMPGTGKTACVNAVIKKLRIEFQNKYSIDQIYSKSTKSAKKNTSKIFF